jgi:hypothetical protein
MPVFDRRKTRTPLPPKGVHAARILHAYRELTRPGGEMRLHLQLKVLPDGPELTDSVALSERMWWKVAKLIGSVGLVVPCNAQGQRAAAVDLDESVLIGRVCFPKVEHRNLSFGQTKPWVETFYGRSWAIRENPAIAQIPFWPETPPGKGSPTVDA